MFYSFYLHFFDGIIFSNYNLVVRGVFMLQTSTLLLQGPYWLSVKNLGFRIKFTLNRRQNLSISMKNMQNLEENMQILKFFRTPL